MSNATRIAIVLSLAALLAPAAMAAPKTKVFKVSEGYGGPESDNGGAGNEQSSAATVRALDGSLYLVVVAMNSDVAEEDRPYQCKL
jgi:hypothetical protein